MFAVIAGEGAGLPDSLGSVISTVPSGVHAATHWQDEQHQFAAIVRHLDLLPEDGLQRQPLVDSELVFVCRARLDSRSALLATLGIDAAQGRAMSDGEILRNAYSRWGIDTPEHVYGDFAFVAWERSRRRLVAASDHIGTVPIFYSRQGSTIVLATQVSLILGLAPSHPKLDIHGLGLAAAGKLGERWTMFEGVEHLTGGHTLVYSNGEMSLRRWWNPVSAPRPSSSRLQSDVVEETRALFQAGVATRLRSTKNVVATMSGGIDSTLVAVVAAVHLSSAGRLLDTFTAVPEPGMSLHNRPGWDASDETWAAAVARSHANMLHHIVVPGNLAPIEVLPALHAVSCTAFRNTANLVWASRISAMARKGHAGVVLTGAHGNLGLSYSGSNGDADLLVRSLRVAKRAVSNIVGGRKQMSSKKLRDGSVVLLPELRKAWSDDLRPINVDLSERDAFVAGITLPNKAATPDFLSAFGVEWRDPTADRRLLEHLLRLPLHAFRVGGHARGLARELGRGIIPDVVRLRVTRGSQSPEQATWPARKPKLYRAMFEQVKESAMCQQFLDVRAVEAMLERLFAGTGTIEDSVNLHRALDVGSLVASFERERSPAPSALADLLIRLCPAQ